MPLTGATIGRWAPQRLAMEADFLLVRALRGGTAAMRAMGRSLLPADLRERENPKDYQDRLARTFLTPGYGDGIGSLAARPFQRPVTLKDGDQLSTQLQQIEPNADRRHMSLTRFTQSAFDVAVDKGIVHVLVDMPNDIVPDALAEPVLVDGKPVLQTRPMNQGERIENDIRPYFSIIRPENLINWFWAEDVANNPVLEFVSIYEQLDRVTDDGDHRFIERIRYWSRSEWQWWERESMRLQPRTVAGDLDITELAYQSGAPTETDEKRFYKKVREGKHDLGVVPIVTIKLSNYGAEPMLAKPCLIDLAWTNIDHWQISSGRNNTLFFAGCPIIVGSNLTHTDVEAGIQLGAGAQILSTADAKVGFAETAGVSLTALKERCDELVDQMRSLGNQPLLRVKGGQPTATGEAVQEEETQSAAQSWVEAFEWGLYECYEMAARWTGETLPDSFDISIFRDFGLTARSATDLAIIDAARARKDLSKELWLRELTERKTLVTLHGDQDIQDEIEREQEESQSALASMMPAMPPAPPQVPPGNAPPQPPGAPPPKQPPPGGKKVAAA